MTIKEITKIAEKMSPEERDLFFAFLEKTVKRIAE